MRNYVLMKKAFGVESTEPEDILKTIGTDKGIEEEHSIWVYPQFNYFLESI